MDFYNFSIDPESDKYLSNSSDPPLSVRQDEAPRPKVENKDEKDIENLFDFNQRLGLCSLISKKGLQHLPCIFDRYSSWLWDYVINAQDLYCSTLANYKKIC